MSKLRFVEHTLSDNSVSDSDDDHSGVRQTHDEFLANQKSAPSPESTDEDVAGNFSKDDTPVMNEKKKKKKKKRKKSLRGGDDDATDTKSTVTNVLSSKTPVITSGYLSSFLSKKRNFDISPPPDIEVSKNTYLKQFSEEFKHAVMTNTEGDSEEELENSDDGESIESDNLESIFPVGEESVANDVDAAEVITTAPKLSFYNLPYSITVEEVHFVSMFFNAV
jgi:hypothetical protein